MTYKGSTRKRKISLVSQGLEPAPCQLLGGERAEARGGGSREKKWNGISDSRGSREKQTRRVYSCQEVRTETLRSTAELAA